ncbi:MAG: redoxin domain-containing protein [Candidatus Tectomicrobia bacterium]|nr:redoxin domain-containing protein [Candidatus Tectomicrobia bacterium]
MASVQRRNVILVACAVLLAFALLGRRAVAETPPTPENPYKEELGALGLHPAPPGIQAPDVALPNLDDKTVKLSDFKGKVMLLNFWATW